MPEKMSKSWGNVVRSSDDQALEFWKTIEMDEQYYGVAQPQMKIIAEALDSLIHISAPPIKICEFGCGMGRNLDYLRRTYSGLEPVGIDCNTRSLEIGRTKYGLDLREGSLDQLTDLYHVIFTVSVLAHIPNPITYLWRFLEHGKMVVLLEPVIYPFGPIIGDNVIAHSYAHDYVGLFKACGLKEWTNNDTPLSETGILANYKTFVLKGY